VTVSAALGLARKRPAVITLARVTGKS